MTPRDLAAAGRRLALLPESAARAALDAHCAALADCRRCGHAEALPILAEARATRVMLVGQAPGKTEVVDRKPFAGRAGKTLFRWLAQAGMSEAQARERIYIAAITRCYPGPSPSGRGDRVPTPRERALCAGWLESELSLIRPLVLIPIGRLAIDRFLGPAPLEQLVGAAHRVTHEGGESLAIPLPHPSGASSWVHEAGHRALLDRALSLLRAAFEDAGAIEKADAHVAERADAARSVA